MTRRTRCFVGQGLARRIERGKMGRRTQAWLKRRSGEQTRSPGDNRRVESILGCERRGDVIARGQKDGGEGGGVECGQQQIEARLEELPERALLLSLCALSLHTLTLSASDGLADDDSDARAHAAARTDAPAATLRTRRKEYTLLTAPAALSISKWQALR
ncbi:hypothetical protein L226DRAFT_81626 [Lentinus tigrinus ALCF2SS1-7]|uniref:uncharacterized protein n=1 Tax=Lentinus tigrinus ALCF2SS1-7 TaxID=1328758 RepID=UPI0011662F31|nr:hypothetical protein L226DRAFT_81626 [Lentinus tigrinus ALCF2SS1-7]